MEHHQLGEIFHAYDWSLSCFPEHELSTPNFSISNGYELPKGMFFLQPKIIAVAKPSPTGQQRLGILPCLCILRTVIFFMKLT